MRILLTVPSLDPSFGGPTFKARALAAELETLGHRVDLMGVSDEEQAMLPHVGRFHGTPIPGRISPILRSARRASVVHVLGFRDPVGTVAALTARRTGVPVLLEPAGMFLRRLQSLRIKALFDATLGGSVVKAARVIIATSSLEAAEIAACGVSPDRIALRPNGVDLDYTLRLPPRGGLRAALGIERDELVVLFLGRITAKKGLSLLVRAVAEHERAHLIIAGPDDRDGTLEALRHLRYETEIGDRLHLLAQGLWGREKLSALSDADVFCLYSMTENFGTSAAEAAAAGVPTIVSDECGVAEWLGDGVDVLPYGEPALLAARLNDLFGDARGRAALGERGRRATLDLAWSRIAVLQVELYERARAAVA